MKHSSSFGRRAGSALLAAVLTAACSVPAMAAEPIGSGVAPICDEAYYATLDYYGNLTQGSVVKSYILNGASAVTDYGAYDQVTNLTDGTAPSAANGTVRFDFGDNAPRHFYFEGQTKQPFEQLPWTLSVQYRLNGVPVNAEELAGKTGLVEISVDAIPNAAASDYARSNYILTMAAVFNQNDILSLEAPGAQVQLVGNLRTVLFIGIPGEEEHFEIRVGAEDFAFNGLTFLLMPATLGQLEQISALQERKDELVDDYHRLSGSLDTLLDAVNGLQGSLNASAKGLDELNQARGTISAGKGQVYADADNLRQDLRDIADLLEPVTADLSTAGQAVTDTREVLRVLNERTGSLREELDRLKQLVDEAQSHRSELDDAMDDLSDLQSDLKDLSKAMDKVEKASVPTVEPLFGGMSSTELEQALKQAQDLHALYEQVGHGSKVGFDSFLTAALLAGGQSASQAHQLGTVYAGYPSKEAAYADVMRQYLEVGLDEATATAKATEAATAWATADAIHNAYTAAGGSDTKHLDFEGFLHGILLLKDEYRAEAGTLSESLNRLYTLYEADPGIVKVVIAEVDDINREIRSVNRDIQNANRLLSSVAAPTADLLRGLTDVCKDLEDADELLDTVHDGGTLTKDVADTLATLLDSVNELYALTETYEPELQKALANAQQLTTSATGSVRNVATFFDSFESLLKTSGQQLDQGTKDALSSLSGVLRGTATAASTAKDVKTAKASISDIIERTWDEHSGEVDDLLSLDVNAALQSLTSDQNPSPASVQIIIRTQEITRDSAEVDPAPTKDIAQTTFFGRIAQMFRDLWAAITGVFSR